MNSRYPTPNQNHSHQICHMCIIAQTKHILHWHSLFHITVIRRQKWKRKTNNKLWKTRGLHMMYRTMISNHFRGRYLHALTEGTTCCCCICFSCLPFISLAFGFGGVPAAFALCSFGAAFFWSLEGDGDGFFWSVGDGDDFFWSVGDGVGFFLGTFRSLMLLLRLMEPCNFRADGFVLLLSFACAFFGFSGWTRDRGSHGRAAIQRSIQLQPQPPFPTS